jgi:hypothetical protein
MSEALPQTHAQHAQHRRRTTLNGQLLASRISVFGLQIGYLVVLAAIAVLYFKNIWIHSQNLGTVPIAVPWWGAVGAVLLSLSAVFEHRRDWLPSIAPWYWARPIFGIFMASFGVLVFQAGVLAVGKDLKPAPGVANAQNLFYYVLAFIIGYREETARTLIKRVGDVIIGPGESNSSPTADTQTAITSAPATGTAGSTITVTGTGLTNVQGVTFNGTEATFASQSDSQLTVEVPAGSGTVTVTFALLSGAPITRSFSYP